MLIHAYYKCQSRGVTFIHNVEINVLSDNFVTLLFCFYSYCILLLLHILIMLCKIVILNCSQEVASQATRRLVLEERYQVDGRGVTDVRPIWSRAGCLPRVHGSALFTRGKPQALAVTTLGELYRAGCTSCPRVTCCGHLQGPFSPGLPSRFVQ